MDLFTEAPAAKSAAKSVSEFPTLGVGRAWLTRKGWQPRHGGGYEKAGGYAEMKDVDGVRVSVEVR